MDEMQIDIKECRLTLRFGDDMLLPDFFEECLTRILGCVAHKLEGPQGLKPRLNLFLDVRVKARTLHTAAKLLADWRGEQCAYGFANLLAHFSGR